jgi:hypothetical protein
VTSRSGAAPPGLDDFFVAPGAAEAVPTRRTAGEDEQVTPWCCWQPAAPPRRGLDRRLVVLVVVLLVFFAAWSWRLGAERQPLGSAAAAPAGEGGFGFLHELENGEPVTFDPCRPVSYVVRPDGAPPSGGAILDASFVELSRATGLVFVNDGPTTEAPTEDRHLSPRWSSDDRAPVLVAWSTAAETPALAGDVAGVAGPVIVTPSGPASARYVSGQVVLDAEDLAHAPGDPAGEAAVRVVVLHELGHLVGLDHVDDPFQVMYGKTNRLRGYGEGDLRGLRALGSGRCR